MRKTINIILFLMFIQMIIFANNNNDFYDDAKTYELKGGKIIVQGEISNTGQVDFRNLKLRSLIVRETKLEKGKIKFIGSYRYDGYSLFDILKNRILHKKNQKEFKPVVDLLVIIENSKGKKVVLTWGELYYPANLHRIIIATKVSPIIPIKTKDKWVIPTKSKMVFANDLITERNIENPTKITIISAPVHIKVNRKIKLYSEKIDLIKEGKKFDAIKEINNFQNKLIYPSVFYGRGKGFHGINVFKGVPLKSVLMNFAEGKREKLIREGYFIVSAIDGYRITISYSELFNRNDNSEFLLLDKGKNFTGGRFKIYPSSDFFSDRAIKAINRIYFRNI
jgi:hypothetical protein